MDAVNPAGAWLQVAERYRQMTDEELLLLARDSSTLTEWALQALQSEMRSRGLKLEPEAESTPAPEVTPEPPPEESREETAQSTSQPQPDGVEGSDDPYAEDRQLVELCTVWSLRDAFQVQTLLDRGGIPFFMGPEKATGVDAVTSNFAKGVGVQVMRIGLPWAGLAMKSYEPADEPPGEPEPEIKEIPVRCPKCKSADVVFLDAKDNPPSPKFRWTCDVCGHYWEDDGIVKE